MVLRLPAAVCPGSPEPQPEITTPHAELADFEVVNSVTLEGAGAAPSYLTFWPCHCTSPSLAGAMRVPPQMEGVRRCQMIRVSLCCEI